MLLACAAIGASSVVDDIVADWADIIITSPTTNGNNANVTITFSAASPRTLKVEFVGLIADPEYRINSGTYTSCPSNTEFAVTSGQTVNFRLQSGSVDQSTTVTVRDVTDGNRVIDTFNISVSGF